MADGSVSQSVSQSRLPGPPHSLSHLDRPTDPVSHHTPITHRWARCGGPSCRPGRTGWWRRRGAGPAPPRGTPRPPTAESAWPVGEKECVGMLGMWVGSRRQEGWVEGKLDGGTDLGGVGAVGLGEDDHLVGCGFGVWGGVIAWDRHYGASSNGWINRSVSLSEKSQGKQPAARMPHTHTTR